MPRADGWVARLRGFAASRFCDGAMVRWCDGVVAIPDVWNSRSLRRWAIRPGANGLSSVQTFPRASRDRGSVMPAPGGAAPRRCRRFSTLFSSRSRSVSYLAKLLCHRASRATSAFQGALKRASKALLRCASLARRVATRRRRKCAPRRWAISFAPGRKPAARSRVSATRQPKRERAFRESTFRDWITRRTFQTASPGSSPGHCDRAFEHRAEHRGEPDEAR